MGGYASRLDIDQSGERKTHAKTDKTKAIEHSLYYAGSEGRAAQLTHVAGNGDIASNDRIVVDDHIFDGDYVSNAIVRNQASERTFILILYTFLDCIGRLSKHGFPDVGMY